MRRLNSATLLLAASLLAHGIGVARSVPQPGPLAVAPPPPPTGTKVHAADSGVPAGGGASLFAEKCLMCHGKMGMGTGLLDRRVQPAQLLQRTNLSPIYVIQAVRIGINNMPAITRGEVSDAQLKAIVSYLVTPRKD